MKNKMRIPKGYRLLKSNEVLCRTDKLKCSGEWMQTGNPGQLLTLSWLRINGPYIRRQPRAKGAKI